MKYMLLIYGVPNPQMTDSEFQSLLAAHNQFIDQLKEHKAYIAGDALSPVQTATTIRVRDGKQLVTDGPFAETTEVLGGYYLIEAENLDGATMAASMIPGVQEGFQSIEVRPIMDMG